jgi:hypothetical protein
MNPEERNQLRQLTSILKSQLGDVGDNTPFAMEFFRSFAAIMEDKYFIPYTTGLDIATRMDIQVGAAIEIDEDREILDDLTELYADVLVDMAKSLCDDASINVEVMKNMAPQFNIKLE